MGKKVLKSYAHNGEGEGGVVCGYPLWGRGYCLWIPALGKVLYVDISSGKGGEVCGNQLWERG